MIVGGCGGGGAEDGDGRGHGRGDERRGLLAGCKGHLVLVGCWKNKALRDGWMVTCLVELLSGGCCGKLKIVERIETN